MSSNKVDRLSLLPEDVLSHILSLMPIKFAVRTSILSKNWRYRWMFVTNLDFEDNHPFFILDPFSKFVDRVLDLCKTPQVKLFRLRFSEIWVPESTVSKWINKALRLNVLEIDIQVDMLKLPLSLFTCKTLTKLTLVQDGYDSDLLEWPSYANLPCLKTIDIVVYSNPKVCNLIRGCPVLESLSLKVIENQDDEDYSFYIPTLKHLNLQQDSSINKVVLNVPNLQDLYLGGKALVSLFVMEDLTSLVSVTASFRHITYTHFWVEFLKGIIGAKSLSLSPPCFVTSNLPLPKFPNLKHLELKKSFYLEWPFIFRYLESCSELEHLCIEEPKEICWFEPQSVPTCMLNHLRTMKFSKFKGRQCDIQFLEYMLGNAEVLKTLTITCDRWLLNEEMMLRAQILNFPMASRHCEIHFRGRWSRSTTT